MPELALKNKTAIVGVGYTPMVRSTEKRLSFVGVDAALAAIEDAGLTPADIDGYFGSPSAPNRSAVHIDGVDEVSAGLMVSALGLENMAWAADVRGLPTSAVAYAAQALHSGVCTYALVLRAMYNPTGVRYSQINDPRIAGFEQYTVPYGQGGAGGRHSLWLQRYMYESGATKEEQYTLLKTQRENALRNPYAYWYGRGELTLEDYMNARRVYEPMCLFDIDIPVTGAGAFVMTTADRARDLPHKAYIAGVVSTRQPAQRIFEVSGVPRESLNVAMLYDGYSHFTYYWLEELGFCGKGEAHSFIQGGRIARGGELPLNTFGGSIGEGRLHGFGHVREAAMQVMGRAGERQVPDAGACVVAIGVGLPGETATLLMLSGG